MTVPSSQPQIKVQPSPDLAKAYREKTTFARIAYILLAIECALTGIVVLFLIIAAVLMTIFSSLVSSLVHHSASKDASVFAWYRNYVLISSYTTVLFYAVSFAWLIPMTLRANFHRLHPEKANCLALGVCSIIFCGLLGIPAGILLIIADSGVFSAQKHIKK